MQCLVVRVRRGWGVVILLPSTDGLNEFAMALLNTNLSFEIQHQRMEEFSWLALSDNPFKQAGSIVLGQLHLQAQGTSLDRVEVHGTGGTLVRGITVGTAYR